MKIIKPGKKAIDIAVEVLSSGGLVVYPTETTYGIGADATNAKAVNKLTRYKKRPAGKPYSIAVANIFMAKKYTKKVIIRGEDFPRSDPYRIYSGAEQLVSH